MGSYRHHTPHPHDTPFSRPSMLARNADFRSLLKTNSYNAISSLTRHNVNASGVVGGADSLKKRERSYSTSTPDGRGRGGKRGGGRGGGGDPGGNTGRKKTARINNVDDSGRADAWVRAKDPKRPTLDMTIPEVASLSETQKDVLQAVQSGQNVFVSGRAGSGKSMVIHVLVQAVKAAGNDIVVTAASGIAAGQVNGITLHSLCCLGIDGSSKTPEDSIRAATAKHGRLLQNLSVLVIDEVSMLSAETLKAAFCVIRSICNGKLPKVVLVGDFCQLPPSGRGTHALESAVWKDLNLKIVLLTSAFRQADAMFVQLLDEVRVGSISDASLTALQSRVGVVFSGSVRPTTLTSLRSVADAINGKELAKLKTSMQHFVGKIMLASFDATTASWLAVPGGTHAAPKVRAAPGGTGDRYSPYAALDGMEVSLPANDTAAWQDACTLVKNSRQAPFLTLAVGAQVLWTANISARISNGTRGVVKRFEGPLNFPVVELVSGEEVVVTPFSCTKRAGAVFGKHRAAGGSGSGLAPAADAMSYVYQQLPLQLGWAMTIHKSQGMSIDRAEIDLGDSVFSKGQAYVALSRLRSFNGLALISFSKAAIKADDRVVAWYRRQEADALEAKRMEPPEDNETDN